MKSKLKRSLQDVVEKDIYSVWVDMLRQLVPDERTHRLSVVVAAMLHYATAIAENMDEDDLEEGSVALSLVNANEMDPDSMKDELHDVVKRLFADAGVTFERVRKRGDPYSIADEAYRELFSWYDYPWD